MLRDEYVITDHQERKAMIRQQVEALVSGDETAVIDDGLLDEVTGLVEWLVALRGAFDEAFISASTSAYLFDAGASKYSTSKPVMARSYRPSLLSPISKARTTGSYLRERKSNPSPLGWRCVFFETDKTTSLAAKSERLESVLFQRDLGTLRRNSAEFRASPVHCARSSVPTRLRSVLRVPCSRRTLYPTWWGNFLSFKGIAGRHYALNDGLSDAVADAIEQHYWPKFSGDQLPRHPNQPLLLADRLDTLVGIFGIGQSPTGSKDPFALRRASVAIIRLLLAFAPHANIKAVISDAVAGFESGTLVSETVETVFGYLLERLPAHYEDLGVSVEILRAVLQ